MKLVTSFTTKHSMRSRFFISALIAILLSAQSCSSDEEGVSDEVNANGGGNAQAVNSEAGDETAIDQSNASAPGGEQINNISDNEFADDTSSDQSLNLGNNQSLGGNAALTDNTAASTTNQGTTNLIPSNVVPPTNTPVATDPLAAATPTDAAAVPALSTPPSGTGTVKYVRATTPIADQVGGASVGNLEQGDHPLVWDDGQNAKLANGKVIPSTSLSDKGIGRPRNATTWRSGGE